MNRLLIAILLIILPFFTFAQNERKFVRKGNDLYLEALKDTARLDTATFSRAETEYRKALDLKPDNDQWRFNLADALYKQGKLEEAAARFEELSEKEELEEYKPGIYHNLGNSLLLQQKIDESIEAYKEALRKNPNDINTKYNLAYAQKLKKEQEKQQQQQQQNQDQNKDQNKDQQDQNKDQQQDKDQNKDQDKKDDQKKQDQNKDQQDQNKDQQKQQQQQPKISKQNAEQLLKALENDEKKVQEKVKKAKAQKAKQVKKEKDW